MAHKDDELIDSPSYTATGYLGVVTLEFRLIVFGLGAEILLGSDLSVQVGIVDEGLSFLGRLLYLAWGELFLAYTKECVILKVVPEDTYRRHRLVEGTHIVHLGFVAYIIKVRHILFVKNLRIREFSPAVLLL